MDAREAGVAGSGRVVAAEGPGREREGVAEVTRMVQGLEDK